MTAGVWRAGFRSVSARTPPEPRQKHRFLQRPRAIWRAPVGTVEQLLLWIRIEAEQQRERDLTRRSAARRNSYAVAGFSGSREAFFLVRSVSRPPAPPRPFGALIQDTATSYSVAGLSVPVAAFLVLSVSRPPRSAHSLHEFTSEAILNTVN